MRKGHRLPTEPQLFNRLDLENPIGYRAQLVDRADRRQTLREPRRYLPKTLAKQADHRTAQAVCSLRLNFRLNLRLDLRR